MKNTLKRLYSEYKPLFKGVLTGLGMIAIYDWIIAPGLTAQNTFINIISFLVGYVMILFVGLLIWDNLFKNDKTEKECQETSEISGTVSSKDNEKSNKNDNDNLNN